MWKLANLLDQHFSTAGTRPGTGTWRPFYGDLKPKRLRTTGLDDAVKSESESLQNLDIPWNNLI